MQSDKHQRHRVASTLSGLLVAILAASCSGATYTWPAELPVPPPLLEAGELVHAVQWTPPEGAVYLDVRRGELLEDCWSVDDGAGAEQLPDEVCPLRLAEGGMYFDERAGDWLSKVFAPAAVTHSEYMANELPRRDTVWLNAVNGTRVQRDRALDALEEADDGIGLMEVLLIGAGGAALGAVVGVLLATFVGKPAVVLQ